MKKSILILASLFALNLCAWEAQANNFRHVLTINNVDNLPTGVEKIDLKGKLNMNAGPDDIVAGVDANSVYIHFNQSFGNVSITICNEMGQTVYNTVVNTAVQQTFIIPFSGMNNGLFTLSIDNAVGFVEGDFLQD